MKKNVKWIILGLLIYLSIFMVDYGRAQNDQAPIFAIKTVTYKDGGTKVYLGLGYKVIRYHVIEGRQDTDFGSWFITYHSQK
jgi:hypothetical protein